VSNNQPLINRVASLAGKSAAADHSPGHMEDKPAPFKQRYRKALADSRLSRNLLNFQRSWRVSRDETFAEFKTLGDSGEKVGRLPKATETVAGNFVSEAAPVEEISDRDFQEMRHKLAGIKDRVIDNQEDYLDHFIQAARRNGIIVYEADTPAELNNYVLELCKRKGITTVVKSKTMVSEETGLNHVLEAEGIQPVETDLGEWIAQLSHERPSHMVLPIIHKSRQQVAALFSKVTGRTVDPENVTEQVRVARTELRQDFLKAGMGVSGANALIAESGAVMFIENEGNARLVTTLPSVHVVVAGIEKLLPDYDAAMLQLRLLARSATAQPITSYSTFLSGPTEPGKEIHLVLLDNGRRKMREMPEFKDALRCIRCAACADVCPPYQIVGGHVFGYIYSGAIGLVNTPFHHGLDAAAQPQSLCVQCNACVTVCPVEIPLARQILDVRAMVVEEKGLVWYKKPVMWLWQRPLLFNLAARTAGYLAKPLGSNGFIQPSRYKIFGRQLPLPKILKTMVGWRSLPVPAAVPGRDLIKPKLTATAQPPVVPNGAAGKTVAYFIQCLTDRLYPEMAASTAEIFQKLGCKVVMPESQHCCGLPNLDSGDKAGAMVMAKQTIETLEKVEADYIVTGAASCAIIMLHDYQHLLAEQPEWAARAEKLAGKVMDFITFMDKVVKLPAGALAAPYNETVTYHNFCQSGNVMGLKDEPRRLIRSLGIDVTEMEESNVCCGFGGSTSADFPEVSQRILERKLGNVEASGASVLVTDNPGCVMHMRGGADAQGRPFKVKHITELVAEQLRRYESAR
jgi:L-lactate dehydrogenase complex protein LldF